MEPAKLMSESGAAVAVDPARRGLLVAGLVIASFMSGLDITVVNIALPHMQGSLSAAPDQIGWVLTSYIVAQAVMTPITGWLAARFGVRRMLLVSVTSFTLASVFCGAAGGLGEMVVFRVLQGVAGASLVPLCQAVLLDITPPHQAGRAMAIFSMASVVSPIVGPVVGAVLTEQLSWRWCFYVNLPGGLIALGLLGACMPSLGRRLRRFDFLGFGSLGAAVAAFQLMLDRGPSQDWFGASEIWVEAIVAACGFWVFVVHSLTSDHPLFDPAILRNRNFVSGMVISIFFMLLMYCSSLLLPVMMQGALGYPVLLSGMIAMVRGVVVLGLLQVAGRLDAVVDRRLLIAAGLAFFVISFSQMAGFSLEMAPRSIVVSLVFLGLAQGVMAVPYITLMFATLPQHLRADGSALANLVRSLSGSVGIAMVQALTFSNQQRMHASLAAGVRLDDPVVRAGVGAAYSPQTVEGVLRLNAEINRQAAMVAYDNAFRLMAVIALCGFPVLLLMRQSSRSGSPAA